MSLKGSLESFSLGEIFQSLSINQHTGTLVVHDGEIQKLIYFTNGHIIHLSTGKKDDFRLGDMLVWSRLVNEDQIAEAQTEQESTGRRLGEILVERGWATEDDISSMVVKNIEEEIYDLFLWKKADFEFKVGYFPEEFLDADQKATKVQLSTNSLIMEALRRIDEWSVIRDGISTLKAVFTPSHAEVPIEAMSDIELPDIVKGEAKLVDGRRNVAEIVSKSPASKFEICKLLHELLLRSLIRPLDTRELVQLAEDHFSQGQFAEARKYLEFAVEEDPNNADLRLQLADAYTHTAADKAAVDHLLTAARLHEDHEEYEMQVVAFKKALEIQPRNPEIMEKLFRALIKAEKLVQAQSLGLELGELLRETLQFSKAVEVYKKLVERDPKETSVRMLLAGAYKGMGDLERSLGEYHRVADQLEKEMRFTELEKVYRILKALATKDEDLLRIRQKYERIEKRKESRERRKKLISYGTIIGVLVVVIAVGWEVYARYEYQGRIRWPEVFDLHVRDSATPEAIFAKVEEEPNNFDRYTEYTQFYEEWVVECDETMGQLEEFRKKHMLSIQSFQAGKAHGIIDDLKKTIRQRQALLRRKHEEYKKSQLDQIAEAEYETAERLIAEGQVEEAWAIIWNILAKRNLANIAKTATLPAIVTSDPPGALVYIDGALKGETPCVARFRPIQDERKFRVRLELLGYEAETSEELNVGEFQNVELLLRRKTIGSITVDGAVHGAPLEHDGVIVVCARGGGLEDSRHAMLYRLVANVQTHRPLPLAPAGGKITRPLVHHGSLIIGTSEGIIWRVTQDKGALDKLATVESEETEVSVPITAGPAALPEGKEIYYGTYDGRLFRLDPSDPEAKPALIFRADDTITSIQCLAPSDGAPDETWVLFASLDERVRLIRGETGKVAWEFAAGGDVVAPPAVAGKYVLVGTLRDDFFVLDRSDGSVVEARHGYGQIKSMAEAKGIVYLGTCGKEPGVTALAVPTCDVIWQHRAAGSPDSGISIHRDVVVYGDRSGRLTVRDAATGDFLWDFRTKGMNRGDGAVRAAITALPLCVGDRVYVGDESGEFTTLDMVLEREEEPK